MSRISLATEMCRADQLQQNNGNTVNMNNVHYCESYGKVVDPENPQNGVWGQEIRI